MWLRSDGSPAIGGVHSVGNEFRDSEHKVVTWHEPIEPLLDPSQFYREDGASIVGDIKQDPFAHTYHDLSGTQVFRKETGGTVAASQLDRIEALCKQILEKEAK